MAVAFFDWWKRWQKYGRVEVQYGSGYSEADRSMKMDDLERTIFHVDVNSAFLSWSALKLLEEDPGAVDLRTIPSGKKYGVQTGEPVVKALQKCPQLVLVPPDFETYRKYSRALMEILARYTPLIQQVSIDEAYMDLTDRIPYGDREGALALAKQIRDHVREQLGFTVNVGISVNKLLAKTASDFEKPDRTHTLYPEEIPVKMWPLPIGTLHGCGKSTAQKLQLIGINTIGEAAAADLTLLQSVLGQKSGAYIWNSANGISRSNVEPEREQAKSVSNERTLSEDITRDNYQTDGVPVICMLSEKVAGRMQKSGLTGQTVTFQVKSSDFERYSRQMSLPDMTDRAQDIEAAALLLADRLLNGPDGLFEAGISIRLIGVGVSRISEKQIHQMDLFEWADKNEEEEKIRKAEEEKNKAQKEEEQKAKRARQAKLDEMMNKVNSRYGSGTLKKGNKKDKKTDDH